MASGKSEKKVGFRPTHIDTPIERGRLTRWPSVSRSDSPGIWRETQELCDTNGEVVAASLHWIAAARRRCGPVRGDPSHSDALHGGSDAAPRVDRRPAILPPKAQVA